MHWFEHLIVRFFPPVNRSTALDIARQALSLSVAQAELVCHGRKPVSFSIYGRLPEPCWWIIVPWDDGKDDCAIRSSRVIAVGKQSGKVHYDGSAGDEG